VQQKTMFVGNDPRWRKDELGERGTTAGIVGINIFDIGGRA